MHFPQQFSESGFTVAELMITLAVVVLITAGYLGSNIVIHQATAAAFERSLALQDAHQLMEQMRDAANQGQFPENVTSAFPDSGTVGGFNTLPNEQVTVRYVDPAADPLDVTVTVTWNANGRRPEDVALRTLITQRTSYEEEDEEGDEGDEEGEGEDE